MKVIALSLFLILISPALVQAGPPLLIDDTGTPGDGHWEINVGFTVDRTPPKLRFGAPLLDFNYGLGERIQLKYEIPWVISQEDGETSKSGLGNSLAGVKWRFLDQERYGLAMSVYPQIEFNNPTSSATRGIVDKGYKIFLPFQVERQMGPLNVTGEAGYLLRQKEDNIWVYGLALGYDLSKRFQLVGEIHGETKRDLGRPELVFNLGFRWKLSQKITLNAAAGRSFRNAVTDEPTLLLYTGLQFIL